MHPKWLYINEPIWGVLARAVISSAIIRIALVLLRVPLADKTIKGRFWILLKGFRPVTRKIQVVNGPKEILPDYWHPFWLGFLELCAFPYFILGGKPDYIGAWIALKTLAQWKVWQNDRTVFNLFLIGQALVLIFSYIIVRQWMI